MLHRVFRVPAAGLVVAAASLLVPAVSGASVAGTGAAGSTANPATTDTGWGAWQGQALSAVARYRGEGPLVAGTPGPVVTSTVATPSGPLAVAQRTLEAEGGGGQVLVQMTVLGQAQVVVTELSLTTSGLPGATLVLRPGTSAVAGTYPRPATGSPATAAGHRGRGRHGSTDAVVRHLGPAGPHRARLTVTGNCSPAPKAPVVISSTFGPLVDGEGVTRCTVAETLSLIVSIYRGLLTHVGTTASASSGSAVLSYSLNSYYFCTHITTTHNFRTSEIWGVNGTDEGGSTSTEAALHCT